MALSDTSKINIALKKVQGKAQTSNTKEVSNESIGSNISIAASTIFGDALPTAASSSFYTILDGVAEMIRFVALPIDGTKDSDGRYQAFSLQLPSDYESNSSNSKAGSGVYLNDHVLSGANGTLQIISPTFGASYTALSYHTSSGISQIAALDDRDWVLDYYNGVFFQQDPPSDTAENPVYVDAFLYIGDYVGTRLGTSPGIFTVIDGSNAAVTSSLNIGGTTAPAYKLVVSGTLSSSVNISASSFYGQGLVLDGGMSLNRTSVTAHMTASKTDYYLGVDSTGSAINIRLPDASTLPSGHTYVVKDEGGAANTNNITVYGLEGTYFNSKATNFPNDGCPSIQVGGTDAPTAAELFELTDWTISAWIRLDSAGGGSRVIFQAGATGQVRMLQVRSNAKLRYSCYWSDNVSSGGPHEHYWEATTALSDSTWYHIALTYDGVAGSNNPIFYINGAVDAISAETVPEPAGTLVAFAAGSRARVGGSQGSCAALRFEGDIDDIAIYSGSLSAANVNILYNNGSGPTDLTASSAPETGSLYSWWRMGDDTNDAIDGTGTYLLGTNSIVDQKARANGNPHADTTTTFVTGVLQGPVVVAGQSIDATNSIVLTSPYTAISLYCNGTDKFFIY